MTVRIRLREKRAVQSRVRPLPSTAHTHTGRFRRCEDSPRACCRPTCIFFRWAVVDNWYSWVFLTILNGMGTAVMRASPDSSGEVKSSSTLFFPSPDY